MNIPNTCPCEITRRVKKDYTVSSQFGDDGFIIIRNDTYCRVERLATGIIIIIIYLFCFDLRILALCCAKSFKKVFVLILLCYTYFLLYPMHN